MNSRNILDFVGLDKLAWNYLMFKKCCFCYSVIYTQIVSAAIFCSLISLSMWRINIIVEKKTEMKCVDILKIACFLLRVFLD